ncbi:MAG: hypothetical protein JSW73_03575 [Candidatus Woesearchaeota archaeon]|nr:MAG: hypothetical protein JSW73_03575 [Candidatus Woesearchaeota archaeon]
MKLLSKAPLIIILFIIASFILYGFESMLFGFKQGWMYFLLAAVIIVFLIIYFKISKD